MDAEPEQKSLIEEVNLGIEQLERGEGVPLDIEEIKREIRKRIKTESSL